MLPKQFLVDDLGIQLAHNLADLQTLRRRMERSAQNRRKQKPNGEGSTENPLES